MYLSRSPIGQHSPALALAVRAASTLPLVTLDTGRLSAKRLGSGYCRWYKRHWLIKLFEKEVTSMSNEL